jgi:hypothetical protein
VLSEVFERAEMEGMFGGLVTAIAGGSSFCVKEETEQLFSTPFF